MRAVELSRTDMTDFILRAALREARSVVEEHERVKLTRRGSHLVLELLDSRPPPTPSCEKPRAPCRSGRKTGMAYSTGRKPALTSCCRPVTICGWHEGSRTT